MYKYKAYTECLVEIEKELNIELDIITWCVIGILYKELDILDIKTWYYISIPTYICIALLIVREY
jgi:hypothetical protein